MIGSQRIVSGGKSSNIETFTDITLGRQALTEDGSCPNDILLSINDLAISRTHARFILPKSMAQRSYIPPEWIEF